MHTEWTFCPSTPAAILFTVLFALTTFVHIAQAVLYKKRYCWVIVCSGFVQTLNYIFRIVSIKNPTSLGAYTAWFVLVFASHSSHLPSDKTLTLSKIAPLLTNGFVYMVMGESFTIPSYNFIKP
jgi:hypothetical protein